MSRSFFHNAIKATIMLILFVFETREKGGKKKITANYSKHSLSSLRVFMWKVKFC